MICPLTAPLDQLSVSGQWVAKIVREESVRLDPPFVMPFPTSFDGSRCRNRNGIDTVAGNAAVVPSTALITYLRSTCII